MNREKIIKIVFYMVTIQHIAVHGSSACTCTGHSTVEIPLQEIITAHYSQTILHSQKAAQIKKQTYKDKDTEKQAYTVLKNELADLAKELIILQGDTSKGQVVQYAIKLRKQSLNAYFQAIIDKLKTFPKPCVSMGTKRPK